MLAMPILPAGLPLPPLGECGYALQTVGKYEIKVTIKFGKGHAEPFTARDGREFMRIKIPNIDPEDKSPWASFVLPARAVHENQYGKGLWAKIPAEGTTVVTKPIVVDQDDAGKNIWQDEATAAKAPATKSRNKAKQPEL